MLTKLDEDKDLRLVGVMNTEGLAQRQCDHWERCNPDYIGVQKGSMIYYYGLIEERAKPTRKDNAD